jgi:deoxyribodipyrimidine photo-lyase
MSTHPDSRTAVVLYTRDLRVHDLPGLVQGARSSEYGIPLFVLDEDVLDRAGPNRIAFRVEALGDLRESLRKRGADLVRRGDPVAETLRLYGGVRAEIGFAGEDVTPYARRRELRLATACQGFSIESRLEHGKTVVQPGPVVPDGGDHYRIFTPYWRRWCEVRRRTPLSTPTRLRLPSRLAASELTPAPVAQARRFDPDGDYVRRWVPELRALPGPIVHEPWKAADSLFAPEYLAPIVEPASPRRRAHAGRT